jgi:membrane peptidoglycan carboxypeptidase
LKKKLRHFALLVSAAALAACAVATTLLWSASNAELPFLVSAVRLPPQTGEIIYADADATVFDREIAKINYRSLALAEIDQELTHDLIALEDRRFEDHHGVDFWRTLRAGAGFIFSTGQRTSGGSTLTQQLIKNLLLHHERTLKNKALEILLALRLESALKEFAPQKQHGRRFVKTLILEAYWNHLFISHRYRGLKNLAERVLHVKQPLKFSASERTLVLAAVRSPAMLMGSEAQLAEYLQRTWVTLQRVGRRAAGAPEISRSDVKRWHKAYALLRPSPAADQGSPQLKTSLAKSISNLFDLRTEKRDYAFSLSHVKTQRISKLDSLLQKRLERRLAALNGQTAGNCLVTGAFLLVRLSDAAVISAGEDRCNEFNELVQAKRQVSSTIKPFLYAFAFETQRLNPASLFDDRRVTVIARDGKTYSPGNHYKSFRGTMNLKTALQISANTVSLQLFEQVNKAEFTERLAHAFARYPDDKVKSLLHTDHSLALGTVDLSAGHVASAYLTLLSQGRKVYPYWGSLITGAGPHESRALPAAARNANIFEVSAAEQVREMLTAVLRPEGTGGEFIGVQGDVIIQELGAKSGSGPVDTWFVGYSQDLLLLVWLGFRQRSDRPRDFHAATLWYDLYLETLPWFRPRPMVYEPGLERRYFCAETGLPPTPGCRRIASALFSRGSRSQN